jgi:hypothetical protein
MRTLRITVIASVLCLGRVHAGDGPAGQPRDVKHLPGQVIVDPGNRSYLVYNRDANGDGELDPFFLIGPGDPEGFLYLGERRKDGTRSGHRQDDIIRRLAQFVGQSGQRQPCDAARIQKAGAIASLIKEFDD